MKNKLAQYKQYKEELSAELRKYVQDKNNPLDERFEALCECPELAISKLKDFNLSHKMLELSPSIIHFYIDILDYKIGNTISVEIILKDIDYWCNTLHDTDSLDESEIKTFKEYCCDNFISSMIFDW
jgi:hypothetical protein